VEQTSDHLMEMLSGHTLDLAIGRFTDVTQSQFFDFQPLGPEPFRIVVNNAHPCAQKKFCTLEELLKWPWVLYPKGTPIRERMEGAF
ncbi:LysR substrate-binding domain-containing protein, partial [Klebsiella pneumoniae]|uniref:LysR substrate-binding domain-containing protein n=1 Tax=Klebsiella pneumoniae TaxID=573 RepID=UPI0022287C51